MRGNVWAIILAGGDGSRLSTLTVDHSGTRVPKQFCSLCSGRSLLGGAVARAHRLTRSERIVVVVTEGHRRWWVGMVGGPFHVLVQPHNRGTGMGVLVALQYIVSEDPDALVVVLPSDHYVEDEIILRHATRTAINHARRWRRELVLLGMNPRSPEPGYGWIVPADHGVVTRVVSFIEKPTPDVARRLMDSEALWNTFIFAARVQAVLDLYASLPPAFAGGYESVRSAPSGLEPKAPAGDPSNALPAIDFSRDLLAHAPQALTVVRAPECGWTDLGTPERVLACLARACPGPPHPAPPPIPVSLAWAAARQRLSLPRADDSTRSSGRAARAGGNPAVGDRVRLPSISSQTPARRCR